MSQLPFPFGSGVRSQHQTTHQNKMPATNPAVHPTISPMQQSAFMQNSQLPSIDMAAILQGVTPEQLAVIGHLYQSGLIPLPPAQTHSTTQSPATIAPPVVDGSDIPSSTERQEAGSVIVDEGNAEREIGEWTPPRETGFLHPPPTGPKKRSGSVNMRPDYNSTDKRAKRQPSPPRQPQSYDRRRPEPRNGKQASSPPRSQFRQRKVKQDSAKKFVLAMHNAGVAFDAIAREVGDVRMLRVLFKELGLNPPSEKPQPKMPQSTPLFAKAREQSASASAAATPSQGSPLHSTVAKPAIKPIPKPLAVAKAPVAADRSAYLAKLQAAKNKKNEALLDGAKTSPAATPATSFATQAQQPPAVEAVTVQSQPILAQPKKAKVQTELIRKRLEALKGEQARKQEAERLANAAAISAFKATSGTPLGNLSASQTPSRSSNGTPGVTAPPSSIVAQKPDAIISKQPAAAPAQAFDSASQFPGLPGLFMTGTPAQIPSVPHASSDPVISSKSVSAPAEATATTYSSLFDQVTSTETSPGVEAITGLPNYKTSVISKASVTSSGQATPKYPFSQNRYDSNDDSVIIHVSDEEESELDDMEEDDEAVAPAAPKTVATKPGPLRNFPLPVMSVATSAPATPGATTPGCSAYERKLQEINDMHRRIAEMQKQPRKPKAKPASPTIPESLSTAPATSAANTLPGLATTDGNTPEPSGALPGSSEQRLVDSSQQMEAKLAQLEEEAEIISVQRQAALQTSQTAISQQANLASAPDADSITSSDDGDDAMDLSSGEDRDSDEEMADNDGPGVTGMEDDLSIPTIPAAISANQLPDSSSDSDDSSTDFEDDYEPAPAVSHDDVPGSQFDRIDPRSQNQNRQSPVAEAKAISSVPVAQAMSGPQDPDLAPELQPSVSEQALSDVTPEIPAKPYYKPYESPLRIFKDYRFHPQFTSNVSGGFRSLTYSNKLEPTQVMCPNELSNGTCQDASCQHQHFYNTAVNDSELLRDLGTHNAPWKTEEEKTRWTNGLSEIVKQLRNSNQGSDVNAVAARIAQYRRDFVGAPDQIINLKSAPAKQ